MTVRARVRGALRLLADPAGLAAGDVMRIAGGVWAAGAQAGGAGPLSRLTIPADSTLQGSVIGAATETAHTPITLPSASTNTARRVIRFHARLDPPAANAADTWRVRLRLGAAGVGGVQLIDSGAWDLVAALGLYIMGEIGIVTVGVGGTFDAYVRLVNEATAAESHSFITLGALDTTVARDLTLTGESSSANVDQRMTLRRFDAEVWAA